MGLEPEDPLPDGISLRDAYAAVRSWYQANVDQADEQVARYAAAAKPYIEALPSADAASEDQMKDCLRRVIASDLEWGYHSSDGSYKMAAYAFAAFDTVGENWHDGLS
jgi:hypothetical protein